MTTCPVCGDVLKAGVKVCELCGTNLTAQASTELSSRTESPADEFDIPWDGPEAVKGDAGKTALGAPTSPTLNESMPPMALPATEPFPVPAVPAAPPPLPARTPPAQRQCPSCRTVYGPEYTDPFCPCGLELVEIQGGPAPVIGPIATDTAIVTPVVLPSPVPPPPAPPPPPVTPDTSPAVIAPASGSRCLVLYGADKKPLHYFPLKHDVTVIGRQDPLRGHFPEIDVGEWLDEATARKVSRKHALLFHSRADDSFTLRPLTGNTGTQIEQDMVEALKDYPLRAGTRLILGGVVRFKFEVMP